MADVPTREEAIRLLAAMIEDIPVAMLTTTGLGRLRSRPMVTQRAPFDGALWFLTARATGKTGEIRDRQAVHVTLVSPTDNRYVWASGTASVVEDPAMLKSLWHAGYLPWLPGGADDHQTLILPVHRHGYANARATPNMAPNRPTSQKRCTTWVSLQPRSSKCRCTGAILKIRLPPVRRK